MNPMQPLAALFAQTERQRDLALAEQVKAQAAHDAAQAQAHQLRLYRQEYEQRWSAQFSREGRIELVHCYQGFMERLSQAVDSQVRTAQAALAHLEQTRAAVCARELQLAAVRKLVERRLAEARRLGERLDQKRTDELAARVAWSRRPLNDPTEAV